MSDEKARELLRELVKSDHFCKFQLAFLYDSIGFFRPELVDKVRDLLDQGVPKPDIITLLKEHVGRCSGEICVERERAHDELTALRAEVARLRDSLVARDRLIGELLEVPGLWCPPNKACGPRCKPMSDERDVCWVEYIRAKHSEWEAQKGNAPGETGKGSERG